MFRVKLSFVWRLCPKCHFIPQFPNIKLSLHLPHLLSPHHRIKLKFNPTQSTGETRTPPVHLDSLNSKIPYPLFIYPYIIHIYTCIHTYAYTGHRYVGIHLPPSHPSLFQTLHLLHSLYPLPVFQLTPSNPLTAPQRILHNITLDVCALRKTTHTSGMYFLPSYRPPCRRGLLPFPTFPFHLPHTHSHPHCHPTHTFTFMLVSP